MKTSLSLHILHVALTTALLWLALDQRSELKALKDDISVTTVFLESAARAAVQSYNPQITTVPQHTTSDEYDITVKMIDAERAQVGPEVFPLDQTAKRLPSGALKQKKRALIIAGTDIPMESVEVIVNHLGRSGISDVTFSQK